MDVRGPAQMPNMPHDVGEQLDLGGIHEVERARGGHKISVSERKGRGE